MTAIPCDRPHRVADAIQDIADPVTVEAELRASEAFLRAVLDGLAANIAILDKDGNITATNQAWRRFWSKNGGVENTCRDANYLDVCARATGPSGDDAQSMAESIRKVLRGESDHECLTYSCHSEMVSRWFMAVVTPIDGDRAGAVVAHYDLSQQVLLETKLHEERALLREILTSIPYSVFWKDRYSNFIGCNRSFALNAGVSSPDEVVGKSDYDLPCTPQEAAWYQQRDREVMEGGVPLLNIEETLRRADGKEMVLLTSKVPLRDINGKIYGMVGLYHDITERKAQDERVRLLSAALEAAANSVVITDREGLITWTNPAFTRMTGYEAHEVVGCNPRILKSGRHPPSFYRKLWQTILDGGVWHGVMTNRRKDGSLYTEELTITPVGRVGEKPTHFIAIKQDITERNRAEVLLAERYRLAALSAAVNESLARAKSLRPMLQRVAEVVQHSLQVAFFRIWTLDESKEMLELEASAGMYTHIDGGHARVPVGEFKIGLIAKEGVPHLTNDVLNDPRLSDQEWARREGMVAFAGHPLIVEGKVIGVMALFSQRTLTQGTLDALTSIADSIAIGIERKRSEAEIARLNRASIDASRQAGMAEIATGVLHNIGNVLTGVNTSVSCIGEKLERSKVTGLARAGQLVAEHAHDLADFITYDERGRHLPEYLVRVAEQLAHERADILKELESLNERVEHMNHIVTMQQTYAMATPMIEEIDLCEILDQVLRMYAESMERLGIEVVRDYVGPVHARVDKQRLIQILVNLVRNAGHALADSTREDRRLTLRLRDGQEHYCVEVIDNGVGIAEEYLTKIFSFGFTTKKDGHGFGLHGAALAAMDLGGSLSVHSDGTGHGATFTLEIAKHWKSNTCARRTLAASIDQECA